MGKLIDSFIITALILLSHQTTDASLIPYGLITLIGFYLFDLLDKPKLKLIILACFTILLSRSSNLIYFIPIGLYFISFHSIWWNLVFILFLAGLYPIDILIGLIGLYLSYKQISYSSLEDLSRSTHDSLREDALNLKEINDKLEIDRAKDIEIAILTERNRISRGLHNSIGHLISSSILQLEALKVKNQDLNLTNDLLVLQDSLKSGMKDIRENIHRLHDQSIDLKYEIENLGVKYKTLKIKVNYDISSNLSYELKSDIIYIIKESLNNTIKHSDANISSIYLREHNNFFTLQIKDNGSDYLENSPSNGMGLLSIEEIAKKYRGVFNWKYSSGFLVHVTLMKGDLV